MWQIRINTSPALSWCLLSWVHIVVERCESPSWFRLPIPYSYLTGKETKKLSCVNCIVQFREIKYTPVWPLLDLYGVRPPRSRMCCLARLSLFCSAPFWVSSIATRASSSWIVSSTSLSFMPLDPGWVWRRRISLVDILTRGQHVELCSECGTTTFRATFQSVAHCVLITGCYLRSLCSCVRACCLRLLFSSCNLMHRSSRCSFGSRNRRWGSAGRKYRLVKVTSQLYSSNMLYLLDTKHEWNSPLRPTV